MPVFTYTAIDPTSHRVRGVIRADTSRQARTLLLSRGIRATKLAPGHEAHEAPRRSPILQLIKRLIALRQRDQVLDAFENLLTLLESHVPLEEAWDGQLQGRTGKGRRIQKRIPGVLLQLHDGVRLGRPMWNMMEGFPEHFDAADVALMRAGEEAGELPAALSRFVVRRQMTGKLLSTFLAALAYPIFLLIFGSAVVVFLTNKVLPSLNAMLVAAGGQVPWPTQVLIVAGKVIGLGVLPAAFALLLVIVMLQHRSARLRHYIFANALKVPVIGTAWHHWQLAQFCLVLRTLVASGVHLPAALVLAGNATGKGPVANAAVALRDHLMEGYDLGGSDFEEDRLAKGTRRGNGRPRDSQSEKPYKRDATGEGEGFPPWLWRALAVGQATGDLVPVLERVGYRFELAATKSASRLASILEPLMILFIGGLVGLIAYGAMLPIIRLGGVW